MAANMQRHKIRVFGSLNADLVQQVPRIPERGETLRGGDLRIYAGGKGANQACAAALLGAEVEMAGQVGSDVFADRLRAELNRCGVDTSLVEASAKPSGTATIFVLPDGENLIVLSPGANAENSVEFAGRAAAALGVGDFLLCQLEIPLESVHAAISAAAANGVSTVLDPAPAYPLPEALLKGVTILTPNQTEARLLLQWTEPIDTILQAEQAATALQALGPRIVIVKMGNQGCVIAEPGAVTHIPGFAVTVADTTAAGDTFNGALAAGLAENMALKEAARFANAAAALSVTKPGAISSMPSRMEVYPLLEKIHVHRP